MSLIPAENMMNRRLQWNGYDQSTFHAQRWPRLISRSITVVLIGFALPEPPACEDILARTLLHLAPLRRSAPIWLLNAR